MSELLGLYFFIFISIFFINNIHKKRRKMKSKLINILRLMISVLLMSTHLLFAQVAPQAGENIWHLIASIGTEVDQIALNQDACCVGTFTAIDSMNSKIDFLTQTVETDFAGTFTAIAAIDCSSSSSACQQTQLTAPTTIASAGNYCMNGDLSGDVTISASDVTINMNGYSLDGSIVISGGIQNIVIQDGFIAPSIASGSFAIDNSLGAPYVTFQNLNIAPIAAGVGGITSSGANIIIQNCIITPSAGATNATGVNIGFSSSNVIIKNNTISGANNSSGNGGDAINLNNAQNVQAVQCIIPATGNAGGSGSGGNALNQVGSNSQIVDCIIKSTGAGAGAGILGGRGGIGISISAGTSKALIRNCIVLNTGNGAGVSSGGACILDQGIFTMINDCQLFTSATGVNNATGIIESSSTSCIITNCFVQQTTGDGVLVSSCTNLEISNCTLANISQQAINDASGAGTRNTYLSNFAYNVTGFLGNVYTMPADAAVDAPNGSVFNSVGAANRFANVYKL
jgi:hypothetical protein